MNFTDMIATAKMSVLQELRRERKWQTYVVALGLTLCFFLVVGNVLGESSKDPEPEAVVKVEVSEKPGAFHLTDNRTKQDSVWEVSTGTEAPAKTAVAEPVKTKPSDVATRVVEIAAAKAESREPQKAEPPLNDVEQAGRVTESFYGALNGGNMRQAYDKLAPEFQADLPFEIFEDGYATVESISCVVKNGEQIGSGQVRLDLQIDACENGDDTTYYATCILWKTNDDWSIAGIAQLTGL